MAYSQVLHAFDHVILRSQDIETVLSLAPKLKAGTVWVNCHNVLDPTMPFGGYKQSGWGREMGKDVLELYTEVKAVCAKL